MKYAIRITAVTATALLVGGAVATPSADATFPGHRGRIVYDQVTRHSAAPDTSDIYSSRPNGSHPVKLTGSGTASAPVWSRSGRRIAYIDAGAVMVMRGDGRHKRRLVTAGYNTAPTWAPNGRRVAFISDRGHGDQLYIYNLRTGTTRQLTEPGRARARASEPVWAPTGGPIAFVRDTGGQSDLYTIRTSGKDLRRLTDTPDVSEMGPDWAPNANRLVYYRYTGYQQGCFGDGIFLLRLGTGHTRKVVDTGCSDIDPRWSPDGHRVVWQVLDGPTGSAAADAGLFTAGLRGYHRRTVLSGANRWFAPDWQPLH